MLPGMTKLHNLCDSSSQKIYTLTDIFQVNPRTVKRWVTGRLTMREDMDKQLDDAMTQTLAAQEMVTEMGGTTSMWFEALLWKTMPASFDINTTVDEGSGLAYFREIFADNENPQKALSRILDVQFKYAGMLLSGEATMTRDASWDMLDMLMHMRSMKDAIDDSGIPHSRWKLALITYRGTLKLAPVVDEDAEMAPAAFAM